MIQNYLFDFLFFTFLTSLLVCSNFSAIIAQDSPHVIENAWSPSPMAGFTEVNPVSPFRVNFSTPIDPQTLSRETFLLLGPGDIPVEATVNSDLTGGVATLTPRTPLEPDTEYKLIITSDLKSGEGESFERFETVYRTSEERMEELAGFRFKGTLIAEHESNSSVGVGPDGHLYVSDTMGAITRYHLDKNGLPTGLSEHVLSMSPAQIVGFIFDPGATADNVMIWVSYAYYYMGNYTGTISRLHLPPGNVEGQFWEEKFITGLPHDELLHHQPNGLAFGPDNRLYQAVGGVATLGGSPNWRVEETLLSGTVIVADVLDPDFNAGELPVNVRTAWPMDYDPFEDNVPVQIYATGLRNAYDLVWHSNGHLYSAINQNSIPGGVYTPEKDGVPAITAMPHEQLARIVEGNYYGHPNPARDEYVLNGGNPTDGEDPWQVTEYPVGVMPEPHFDPSLIYDIRHGGGNSANGMAEYTTGGPLEGRLLIAYFSGGKTIQTFQLDGNGDVMDERPILNEEGNPFMFISPIDVAVHPETGLIYVGDFGEWIRPAIGKGGSVWVLEPSE